MIVVYCFSKDVHFIPLPNLPSALETMRLLILHVFQPHEIPRTLSAVVVHSLPLISAGPSVKHYGYQPVCPQDTNCKPMARWNKWTRISRLPCLPMYSPVPAFAASLLQKPAGSAQNTKLHETRNWWINIAHQPHIISQTRRFGFPLRISLFRLRVKIWPPAVLDRMWLRS